METDTDRTMHIDAIRRRFGISLEAISKYNSLNRDEIKNIGGIFRMKGADKEKILALLYMLSSDEQDGVIQKFRAQAGLDEQHYSPALLAAQYGTMLTAALIYNPQLYAMAINYRSAVNAGFPAAEIKGGPHKTTIIPFPINYRIVFAAAAAFVVVFFIALLIRINNGTGTRVSNDWIAGLIEPHKGQDGVSFVSDGNEGARVGIRSPLTGIAMAADRKQADVSATTAYYTKAIKTEKNNAALYVNRGIAYTLQGYVDAAITDFSKAIELEPHNTSAYFNRAAAYMGKYNAETDRAIADLKTVININPDDSGAYYALGVLYFRQYENDAAKPRALLEKSLSAFSHIQGYQDADIIFDYLSRLL